VRWDRLLLVALDDLRLAWAGGLRVGPCLAKRSALTQEVPALVERHLDRLEATAILVRGDASSLALPELVLFCDELLDPSVNLFV
jgi:hypothetical protein